MAERFFLRRFSINENIVVVDVFAENSYLPLGADVSQNRSLNGELKHRSSVVFRKTKPLAPEIKEVDEAVS